MDDVIRCSPSRAAVFKASSVAARNFWLSAVCRSGLFALSRAHISRAACATATAFASLSLSAMPDPFCSALAIASQIG